MPPAVAEGHWITHDGRHIYIDGEHGTVDPDPFRRTVPVPKGLATAQTIEEINGWFKKNYHELHVDFTGCDPVVARRLAIVYNDLATKFNGVELNINDYIDVDFLPKGIAAYSNGITLNQDNFATVTDPKSLDYIHRDVPGARTEAEYQAYRNHATGYTTGDGSVESLVVHEYGHAIHRALTAGAYRKYGDEVSRADGDAWRHLPDRGGISERAKVDEYEAFAEAFSANYYRNNMIVHSHPSVAFQRDWIKRRAKDFAEGLP